MLKSTRQLAQLIAITVLLLQPASTVANGSTSMSTPTSTQASPTFDVSDNFLTEDTEVIQMLRRQTTRCNDTTCVIKFFDATIKPYFFVGDCRAEKVKQIHFIEATTTQVPVEIFEVVKKLQVLSLNESQIVKITTDSFKSANSLIETYLAHNEIEEIESRAFSEALNLVTLNLNSNKISTIDKDAFRGLLKLRVLNLANNEIEVLDPTIFNDNPQLFSLELSGNRLRVLDSNMFHNCESLAWVYLNGNQLERLHLRFKRNSVFWLTVDDNVIDELRLDVDEKSRTSREFTYIAANRNKIRKLKISSKYNLRNLYLENNEFIDLYEIMSISTLRELRLGNNNLSHINMFAFQNMRSLEVLYLHNTNLQGLRAEMFASQKQLKVLHIGYNRLGYIDLQFLNSLKSLEQLHIDGNDLTSLNVEHLNEWLPSLKKIELRDNPWICRNLKVVMSYLNAYNVSLVSTEGTNEKNVNGIKCEDEASKTKALQCEIEELERKVKEMVEIFDANIKVLHESNCCNFTNLITMKEENIPTVCRV